jgi:hypothetical protein
MKKLLIMVIPLCLLVLSACNFPLSKSPAISSSDISTSVAQTLQAAVAQTPANGFAQTPTAMELSTVTPAMATTATLTPTATISPDDPRLTLGTPSFSETFTNGSSFGLKTPYSDDAITMSISDGSIVMQSSRLNGGIHWRVAYLTPRNLYLEGTFKTVSCSGGDFYGILTRSPDYTSGIGYYFGISCEGKYYLMRFDGSDPHPLIDWTTDAAILAGENQENRIGMMLTDDQISLYINGKLIQKVSNNVITQKGYYGVFQSAVDNPTMTVEVEQIDEWDRP